MIFDKILVKKDRNISRETNIGQLGESMAVKFLKNKGFLIIGRNISFHGVGEIDIICIKDEVLHFVEVKSSLNRNFGDKLHSISHFDREKKEKLKLAMSLYVRKQKIPVVQPRCLDL